MKIAIVHPWGRAKWAEPLVHDGLHGALDLIAKKHQVDWYLERDEPDDSYDWILPWGVASIPFNSTIEKYKAQKALLCAGHPDDTANLDKFNCVFVESPAVYERMKPHCRRIVLAFGTDTDFFKPQDEEKMFDAFYPATYSPWKRQDLFTEALKGYKAMTCGLVQPDGQDLYEQCLKNDTYTMSGLIPTRLVAQLYNMSKVCVITSWHGSERTALEAMASNIPLVVTNDNHLTCSLLTGECFKVDPSPEAIKEGFLKALNSQVNTRQHVLDKYSHEIYANKILKVLEA